MAVATAVTAVATAVTAVATAVTAVATAVTDVTAVAMAVMAVGPSQGPVFLGIYLETPLGLGGQYRGWC